MALRLVLGLVKGLIIGGLLGFALAKLGFAAPGALVAYLGAAVAGALVGLVAGKPIWAADARIEAGLKAAFGALVGAGLMWLARSFLGFAMPIDLGPLTVANTSLQETAAGGTIGGLAITSLALVAAVIGGFYDADNTPEPADEKSAEKSRVATKPGDKARIAEDAGAEEADEDEVSPPKKAKR